ncbi:MAG: TnpV protein [Oscillospiraceae bacterium]|nr:TnpV protein [Oscillospiraceae bacterium]
MFPDGVCRVGERAYSKTVAFEDVNYSLAQNEDKNAIFEAYRDLLNYFDSSVKIQLTLINKRANIKDFEQSICLPQREDSFGDIRREYGDMLKEQLSKGRNGLVREKYLTFTVEANSRSEAKPRLERIEADILANFKAIGASARPLSGAARLELLHGQLHPDGQEKLRFDWREITKTGQSTKDFIAPTSLDFRDAKTLRVGDHFGAVSFLQILAPELSDKMLAEFLDLDTTVTVNLHLRPIDHAEAVKAVKRKLTDLDAMKIAEQKKAVRAGYDMDVLPADLVTYGKEAAALLSDLQARNEKMFLVTFLILNTAKTRRKLDTDLLAVSGIANKHSCAVKRLDFCQEQGFMSSLALGVNQVEIQRGLTTSGAAILVPFTTCDLFQTGHALYYGLNPLSSNLIMAARQRLKNPKGLYCQGRFPNRTKTAVSAFAAQAFQKTPQRKEFIMNTIEYIQSGDYLLPAIRLSDPPNAPPLGKYGRMHKEYLRREKSALYSSLLLSERLYPICREIDIAAQARLDAISDREIAHEIILAELVYV